MKVNITRYAVLSAAVVAGAARHDERKLRLQQQLADAGVPQKRAHRGAVGLGPVVRELFVVTGPHSKAFVLRAVARRADPSRHAIVFTRGGGSDEDLGALVGSPALRVAIIEASRQLPLLFAVGHAADVSAADALIHPTLRCTTPTDAAYTIRDHNLRSRAMTVASFALGGILVAAFMAALWRAYAAWGSP